MRPYTDFNAQKWAQAKHEFEKANVKLMKHTASLINLWRMVKIMKLTTKEQIAVRCFPKKTHSRALAILTAYIW